MRVAYSNPENGFMIGTFLEENSNFPITIKGIVFQVKEQQMFRLEGHWESHEKYGKQFSVSDPQRSAEILKFLLKWF